MRLSLFERLKQKQLSYIDELNRIVNLAESDISLRSHLYNSFKCSSYCVYYENYRDALIEIFNTERNINKQTKDLKVLINKAIATHNNLTLDSFLDYLELFKTLLSYKSQSNMVFNQIKRTVDYDCDKIGYCFILDKSHNAYKVRLKNPEAESIATKVDKSTRDKIYNYLTIRKGKIDEKRSCLKMLADDIEIIIKKYDNDNYYKKAWHFIQCIRHTKDDVPFKEFSFYYENEEEWLDKIFEIIIGILSFTKTKEIINEIKTLESQNQ